MTFEEYQKDASRTSNTELGIGAYVCYALGLSGEAGEYANKIKKVLYHGHAIDKKELLLELGDCLWYISMSAEVLGSSLENLAEMNVEKRKLRYPNGFSEEASRNRIE